MATRKAKAPTARPWWHPEKLTAHNKKHGKEVSLVRQTNVGNPMATDYENSSLSTIHSAFYSIELKHLKDDYSYPPSGYSTDSFGLLSIQDTQTNRIRTHFPIGAFGETQSQWLGTLPRPFRELHALRNIYTRVRCGLYVAKKRKPSEMIEKYLNSLTKKEIECCSLLKQKELRGITPEAANWLKMCFVCDWQHARHCVTDISIRSEADKLVGEFVQDQELCNYASGRLSTLDAEFAAGRLCHTETTQFPESLGDNSWTFTEAVLHFVEVAAYQDRCCALKQPPNLSSTVVADRFRRCIALVASRPYGFRREVACFLRFWLNTFSRSETNTTSSAIKTLINYIQQ